MSYLTFPQLAQFARKPITILSCAIACASVNTTVQADVFQDAFAKGSINADFRMRFEDVEDGGAAENADALTLKSRLTMKTGPVKSTNVVLELDDVTSISSVDYNDLTNGESTTPIADPEGSEVNQAFVSFKGIENVELKYGRQRILLDNQRFVGGVGFRQNEQTYDAFSVKATPVEGAALFYAYITNVNRIVGEAVAAGDHNSETHLINASYAGTPIGKVTGYAYLIDNKDAISFSTDTYGLRVTNSFDLGDSKAGYAVEFATQSNAADNKLEYDATYTLLEGNIKVGTVKFTLGHEILGTDDETLGVDDGRRTFITPLATLHKFQGWTDQFLGTPETGIEDTYLSAGTMVNGIKLLGVYHSYSPNEGDGDIGTELGFLIAKKFSKKYGVSLKYSDFSADDGGPKADKTKLWLTGTAKF